MGGSQVYLEAFEKQTVDTMIKCISIASANDASVAMAEYISGSESEFVAAMNEKAKSLGMENTHFLNCCGLDDDITEGHYSTAYDIALMSRELITRFPQISDYSTVWMDTITHTTKKGSSEFGLNNTNKLVRTYDGITGLKTGSTSKAKYCLSATAKRNGVDLIAVVMACESPKDRFSEAAKLLDYGFANTALYTDENEDLLALRLPVTRGKQKDVKIMAEEYTQVLFEEETTMEVEKEILYFETIEAPLKTGDKVGEIKYYVNKVETGCVSIVAAEDIERAGFGDYFKKALDYFFLEWS
jgi:D-alanyl-D-alanine carboxypeptidase (penicillin-binding protein 5/6)